MSVQTIDFINKLNTLRPNCFDTSEVNYIDCLTEVKLKCLRCNNIIYIKPNYILDKRRKESCRYCAPTMGKITIEDYRRLATSRGFKYLSDDIPKNTTTPGGTFECQNGHRWNTSSYQTIRGGANCKECNKMNPVSVHRITLDEYKTVCGDKGRYLYEVIPATTSVKIPGWLCYSCNNIYESTYHNIQMGAWCNCYRTKSLNDYQKVCSNKGFYILEGIPSNISIEITGWCCRICNSTFTASFVNVEHGYWCRCIESTSYEIIENYKSLCYGKGEYILPNIPSYTSINVHGWLCYSCGSTFEQNYLNIRDGKWCNCKRKCTLEDYQTVAGNKGKYLFNSIPESTTTIIDGWLCYTCNNVYRTRYSNVKQGVWCECSSRISLKDYQEVAGDRGEYILESIPQNSNTKIDGWLCYSCDNIYISTYHNIKLGHWCGCTYFLKIEDYQNVADNRGRYILTYFPNSSADIIKGWTCNECNNIFESSYSRVKSGAWCNCTVNKTERRFKEYLSSFIPNFIHQFKPIWLVNPFTGHKLSYDFFFSINGINFIIEVDGTQHFENVSIFSRSANYYRKRDIYKMKKALENNIFVIRILQSDIYHNRNDWSINLYKLLSILSSGSYKPYVSYFTFSNVYDKHKEDMESYDNVVGDICKSLQGISI